MNGRYRVLCTILLLSLAAGLRAQSASDTVRELAQKIIAATGTREEIAFSFRNLSPVGASEAAALRQSLMNELRAQGARLSERPGASEIRVTLSGNPARFLLIAEANGGVILLPFAADAVSARSAAAVTLEKVPLIEQREQILDVAMDGQNLLLLEPSKISYYTAKKGGWDSLESVNLPSKSWPRDLRGMLHLEGDSFQAYVPGLVCAGTVRPSFGADCRQSNAPWPVALNARFAAGRNYFDGLVAPASGSTKTMPPFFAVAPTGAGWIFTGLDGRVSFYDKRLNPAGSFAGWGSDIAGLSLACAGGAGQQVLATLPAGGQDHDSVQAFEIVDSEPVPLSAPVEFPGPVTALWTSDSDSAIVVSRDTLSGKYAAYALVISCRD